MVPGLSNNEASEVSQADTESFLLNNRYDAGRQSSCDRKRFSSTQVITEHLPTHDFSSKASSRFLISNCALCPSLKAVSLASYFKLHRPPPPIDMGELQKDRVATIDLPPQESIPAFEPEERMPEHGVHNKLLEHVVRTPGRLPSPQPTHLGVPGVSPHRVIQEGGPGYVAPKFEGKEAQMDEGNTQGSVFLWVNSGALD